MVAADDVPSATAADLAAAHLLAAALAAEGAASPVPAARTGAGSRLALLAGVVAGLREADAFDARPVEPPRPAAVYLGDDHRWEGWREDEPADLPDEPGPTRADVVAALRRLPLPMRAVLVLRDAAGLGPGDCASVVAGTFAEQTRLLDQARRAYVTALAERLAAR